MPQYAVNIEWEDTGGQLHSEELQATGVVDEDDGVLVVPGDLFLRAGCGLPTLAVPTDVVKVDVDYHLQFKNIDLLLGIKIPLRILKEWIETPVEPMSCGDAHTITKNCRRIPGGCLGVKLEHQLDLEGDSEDFDDAEYIIWRGGL